MNAIRKSNLKHVGSLVRLNYISKDTRRKENDTKVIQNGSKPPKQFFSLKSEKINMSKKETAERIVSLKIIATYPEVFFRETIDLALNLWSTFYRLYA